MQLQVERVGTVHWDCVCVSESPLCLRCVAYEPRANERSVTTMMRVTAVCEFVLVDTSIVVRRRLQAAILHIHSEQASTCSQF